MSGDPRAVECYARALLFFLCPEVEVEVGVGIEGETGIYTNYMCLVNYTFQIRQNRYGNGVLGGCCFCAYEKLFLYLAYVAAGVFAH